MPIQVGSNIGAVMPSRQRYVFSANGTYYLDIAKSLSLQERRLHRQKQIFTVFGGYYKDVDGSTVHFNTAPNTWPVKASIKRGFRMWKKMISQTLKNTDGMTTGKWNDFKIYLDNQHGNSPILPVDASGQNLYSSAPEWDYSTLTSADTTEAGNGITMSPDQYELHIVGPHAGATQTEANAAGWTRVGLLESWVNSRPIQDGSGDPVTVDNGGTTTAVDPLSNLFDVADVDDDKIMVINDEGDLPPYDPDDMFGNSASAGSSNNLQRMSSVQTSSSAPIQTLVGFQAICGLVQVVVTGLGSGDTSELVLDVDTRGVAF